jgi:hypothetical protein
MYNEFGKKPKFTLVTVIAVAAVMLVAATTEMAITGYAFAYNRNQATSAANDCGNNQVPTNIGCQNTNSQIEGDENSIAITSLQTFPEPTEPELECPTDYILRDGECVAEPIVTLECAVIGGIIPTQIGDDCSVTGPINVISPQACSSVGGAHLALGDGRALCVYPATIEVITCPGGITPTNGECVTMPTPRD